MKKNKAIQFFSLAMTMFLCTGMTSTAAFAEAEQPEEAYYEVSCPLFSVHVPESLRDICTVESGENSISFYEKISNEKSYGGFVGGIFLYQGPEDYGFLPSFSRGGEIDFSDGSKLDIVWRYPTDIQYDYEDEQSTANYKLISDTLPLIGEEIYPADGAVFVRQEDIDTTGIYDEILEKLKTDLTEKKSAEELLEDDFTYLYAYLYDQDMDPLEAIGYAYTDVNGDGYKELIIGAVGDTDIYDMYAPVDGKPAHIFSGTERNRFQLCGHEDETYPMIRNDASGSAFYSEIGMYLLDPNQPELYFQFAMVYDSETDPENPYFYRYSDDDLVPTTEEEWKERLEYFEEIQDPGYVSLTAMP